MGCASSSFCPCPDSVIINIVSPFIVFPFTSSSPIINIRLPNKECHYLGCRENAFLDYHKAFKYKGM